MLGRQTADQMVFGLNVRDRASGGAYGSMGPRAWSAHAAAACERLTTGAI